MSQLTTHYEVKNGKLVPKKDTTHKEKSQDKPATGSASNASGYGDDKK